MYAQVFLNELHGRCGIFASRRRTCHPGQLLSKLDLTEGMAFLSGLRANGAAFLEAPQGIVVPVKRVGCETTEAQVRKAGHTHTHRRRYRDGDPCYVAIVGDDRPSS
jgi:hypothetical protein